MCSATPVFAATLMVQVQSAGEPDSVAVAEITDPLDVQRVVADLGSKEFATRQSAIQTLKHASADEIKELCKTLDQQKDNEIIRRLIEVLELRYENAALQSAEVKVVSEAIEKAATSKHWFLAEAASDILNRHWQRRTEIAVLDLIALKVTLSPKDPTLLWKDDDRSDPQGFGLISPTSNRHLKVIVDRTWPNDPHAFELLGRLTTMKGDSFRTQYNPVSIYLIDGHPLPIEQIAVLKGLFGSIAERGRVCLGILEQPRFAAENGIVVREVSPNSSASTAGIAPGDQIVAMNGKKLADFDELVTLLKQFDVGDKIMLHIRSGRFAEQNGSSNVEVVLKGWE
jgi:hypothetical protein